MTTLPTIQAPRAPAARVARKSPREQQLEEDNTRLRALLDFGRNVDYQSDLKSVLALTAQQIAQTTGAFGALAALRAPDNRALGYCRTYGMTEAFLAKWRRAAGPTGAASNTELGEAIRTREPAVYEDVADEPRLRDAWDAFEQVGALSAVAIPIMARGEVLGVIVAYYDRLGASTPEEVSYLTALAEVAATAILNARLLATTHRELRRQAALRRVVESISSELELDNLLERVVANAVELFDCTAGVIGLLDKSGVTRIRAVHHLSSDLVGTILAPGHGICGQALQKKAPVIKTDYAHNLPQPFPGVDDLATGVAVPIWWKGKLMGVFGVFDVFSSDQPRTFDDHDRQIMEMLATHVAIAIENARLYGELRERLADVTDLQAASVAPAEQLEPDLALQTVAEQALALSGSSTVSIELLKPGDAEMEARVSVGEQAAHFSGMRIQTHGSPQGVAVRTGEPQVIRAGRRGPTNLPPTAELADARSLLVLPLRARGRTLGTLSAYTPNPDAFHSHEVELLTMFANQAAISLDNARLYAELHHRLEEIVGLQRLATLLLEEHDFDRVLQAVCELLQKLTDAGGVGLALTTENPHYLELRTVVGPSADRTRGARIPIVGSFAGEALRTNQPQRSNDAMNDPRGFRQNLILGNTHTLLSVPMKTRERTVGVISIYNKRGGGGFTDRDAELATLFANQAAVAIDNARLYEQTREYAVIEERNRLARELHDSVTQSLFSVTLLAQATLNLWERDPTKAKERLERAVEVAQGALAEMRALIFQLRPMALQEEGLMSALKKHLVALRSRDGLDAALHVEGAERRLPAPVEEAAFRIVQESLNNVVKHARATHTDVNLDFQPQSLVLSVEDNGVGFDPNERRGARTLGMASMRERAEGVEGTLTVTSTPGSGVKVRAELPVSAANSEAPK